MPIPLQQNERIIDLVDDNGEALVYQEGESGNITGQFKDFDGAAINKSALDTVELTLLEEETGDVLNSRLDDDIKASVAADGTLTLRLGPLDNAINDADLPEKALEAHIARFVWTWNDGTESRTGLAEYRFHVQKLVVAA